jgi:putative endonuclease
MGPHGIVYILTNRHNTTLYTGVTRNLQRRIAEHKLHLNKGFSNKYNTDKLVYFEEYDRLAAGIFREKQIKKWHRAWKDKLIDGFNPTWRDLAEDIGVDAKYLEEVREAYEKGVYTASDCSRLASHPRDSGSSPE